ncbi:hypothetical protein UPYG_G00090370 [Umbra pygmaea]|uniref:Uncharacterized protein n=1 Tax=Umbra pygmaea TaxID=75934 RepID=A0ABD0XJ00_UMBPY
MDLSGITFDGSSYTFTHLDHPYAVNYHENEGQTVGHLSENAVTSTYEVYVPDIDVSVTCVQGSESVDVIHLPNVDSQLQNVPQKPPLNFGEIATFVQSNEGGKMACTQPNKQLNDIPLLQVLNIGEQLFILSTTLSSGSVEGQTNPSATGFSQSLLPTLQHSVPHQPPCPLSCKTLNKPCCHTQMPPVEKTCPLSHTDVSNPFPKCTELGLNLNMRPKKKLDLTLLTNGVMVEIYNFAKTIKTALQFVVFDILDHNFDLGLLSEQRWRFVKDVNGQFNKIRRKCNSKYGPLEVFTLPDFQRGKQEARSKKEQENALRFQNAYEAVTYFLYTYHDRQLPSPNTSESFSDMTMNGESYTAETSTLAKDQPDPQPMSFGQVKKEPIWADETTPVLKKEESEIDIMSDLVQHIKTESKSEAFETLCTNKEAMPCQKNEPSDISIKDEPDFHPMFLMPTKKEAPWNGTEDAPYTDGIGKLHQTHELPQNHGLNIVPIKNESDLQSEMQGHATTLEHPILLKRTQNNPYPYCRRNGVDLVKSNLGVKKKLDLNLLTMGVMLEIHDFAKKLLTSPQEISVNVVKQQFKLDLKKEQFLRSLCIPAVINSYPKNHALKDTFLNEPFIFSTPVPTHQKTCRPTTLPSASLPSTNERLKAISEIRRLALKKKKEERANMWTKEKEKPAKKQRSMTCTKSNSSLAENQMKSNATQFSVKEAQHVVADIHPQEESVLYPMPTEQESDPKDNQVHTLRKIILNVVTCGTFSNSTIFKKRIAFFLNLVAPNRKLEEILTEYRSEFLPHMVEQYYAYNIPERIRLCFVNKLFGGLHVIDGLVHQAKTTLLLWENVIFVDKEVGSFPSFAKTGLESGTVRLVRSMCDAVQAKGCEIVKFRNFLTGKEFKNFPLVSSGGNRLLDTLCENAAVVYSIHNDLLEFTSANKADSCLFKDVVSDLEIQQFKAGCRALGLVSKIILDPLWRALVLNGNISDIEARYQALVSKLEEWRDDGRQVVEGNACLFDDIEVAKDFVFHKLTMQIDPDFNELTVQVVEILLASFLMVCGKMLSSNPDYCRHVLPSDNLRVKLKLMPRAYPNAQGDFGLLEHLQRAKSGAIGIAIESMVMFKRSRSWTWLPSLDREKIMLMRKTLQGAVKHQ